MLLNNNSLKFAAAFAGGLAIALAGVVPANANDVMLTSTPVYSGNTVSFTTDHSSNNSDGKTDNDISWSVTVSPNCTIVSAIGPVGSVSITTSGQNCVVSVSWSKGSDLTYGSWSGTVLGTPPVSTPDSPAPTPEVEPQQGEMDARVYFTPDSPKLSAQAIKKIKKLVKELPEGATNIVVTITGYIHPTTETDPELKAYRQSLPELRAMRVKRQLAKLGIEAEFEVVGIKTPLEADPKSRRAVITISYTY